MTSNIFSDLAAIGHFLAGEVEVHTPAHLRSELRGAIKLLADIAREVDALPALLLAEGLDMATLAETATASLESLVPGMNARTRTPSLRDQLARPIGSLRGLISLHEDALADADLIFSELRVQLGNPDLPTGSRVELQKLAARYLTLLAAQADARMPWQSVFPPIAPDNP